MSDYQTGEIVGVTFDEDTEPGFDIMLVKVPSRRWPFRVVKIEWREAT